MEHPNFDLGKLWNDESGQDLVEYSLLLAFIALAAVALLSSGGKALRQSGPALTAS